MTDNLKEREAFEAWWFSEPTVDALENAKSVCEECWIAWQGRAALAQAQSCVPAELRAEAAQLAPILGGMVEGGYADLETLYTDDQADGDAFVKRAAEVLAMLAASPQPQPVQPSDRHRVFMDEWMERLICRGSTPPGFSQGEAVMVTAAQIAQLRGEVQAAKGVAQAKPEQAAQPTQAACEQTTKKELPMLSISDEQAEAIASEVYARNPVDGVDAAFKLDWELVRAGVSHAKALSTDDSCPHGNAHIVHDCLRCGAPVCCGKCCADDAANEPDVAGKIAYQLTKKLVIDMPTARAAVDAAIAALPVSQPLTQEQRRALIDAAGDKTDGLNQDDFADEIVRSVERHHGIAAPQPKD